MHRFKSSMLTQCLYFVLAEICGDNTSPFIAAVIMAISKLKYIFSFPLYYILQKSTEQEKEHMF